MAYGGERIRRFRPLTGTTSTAAEKSGQFNSPIIDPQTEAPFLNNQIPQDRFDSVAVKLMQF